MPPFHRAHAWTPLLRSPSPRVPSVAHVHTICSRLRLCHALVPPRIGPWTCFYGVLESGISLKEPQALENHGRSPLLEGREAEGSRVSDFSADSTP